jgi:hypothetical protein
MMYIVVVGGSFFDVCVLPFLQNIVKKAEKETSKLFSDAASHADSMSSPPGE